MLHRGHQHDGLALVHMRVHLGQLDAQAQYLQAQRGVFDVGHQVAQRALVHRAGVGPFELTAGQQVFAKGV